MNKHLKIVIVISVLGSTLFSFKSAFGQSGSLDNPDARYRNDLVNYILSHNMTINYTQLKVNELMNINTLETYELEAAVHGHKNDCQAGTFEHIANISNLSKVEISNKYGDC